MGMDSKHETGTAKVDTGDEIHERKSKGGAKRQCLRRYYCKICGHLRSKREVVNRHVISQHIEQIGAKGEVDGLIGTKLEKEVMAEAKLKLGTEGKIKGSKQMEFKRYRCKICGFIRGSREGLRPHISSHNVGKILDEDGIEGMMSEFEASTALDVRRYCCQLCGLVRTRRKPLRLHIITEHSEEIAADEEIDGLITKKAREDIVCGLPSKEGAEAAVDDFKWFYTRSYNCKICGIVRSKRKLLKSHVIRCHGLEALEEEEFNKEKGDVDKPCPRVCDECGVSFEKPSHLQQHKLTHSSQEVLKCLDRFSTRWETTLEELVY